MFRNNSMINNLNKLNGIRKSNSNTILFLILIIFILLKPYTLGVFFDEGTYIYRSWRVLDGDILYKDVLDMRPPGHYFFFILPFMFIFKIIGLSPVSTLIGLRIVLSFWEIIAFYFICLILTDIIKLDKKTSIILMLPIIFSPLIVGWSTYIITENIFLLPFFAGLYYYLKEKYVISGILFGIALLTRHTLSLLLIPILLDTIISKKNIKNFVMGFSLPFAIVITYLIITGTLYNFICLAIHGLLYNKQWFTPPSLSFKYEYYLEEPLKFNPAIDLLLFLGILPFFCKLKKDKKTLLILLYAIGVVYWLSMLIFASYNTKYMLPLIPFAILSVGYLLTKLNLKLKKVLLIIILILTVAQIGFMCSTDYLTDPAKNDNAITPFLNEQISMSKALTKYNISDKEWFISHQIITSYFSQIDCYNHLNIKSDYAFPPREKLLPIFSKIKLVMLDPATKFHMKSKPWVADSNMDAYLRINFKIIGRETTINDGFDIFMRDNDKVIVVRYHTNKNFSKVNITKRSDKWKCVYIHRFVEENKIITEDIPINRLFMEYYNYTPKNVYISLLNNADKSTLIVNVNKIEIFDNIIKQTLYYEDFEPIGGTLRMSISNGLYKYRIGNIGNGALTYLYLNYIEVEKIPIHQHQNTDKIVYAPILLNKKYYPELHKQYILERIVIEKN